MRADKEWKSAAKNEPHYKNSLSHSYGSLNYQGVSAISKNGHRYNLSLVKKNTLQKIIWGTD